MGVSNHIIKLAMIRFEVWSQNLGIWWGESCDIILFIQLRPNA